MKHTPTPWKAKRAYITRGQKEVAACFKTFSTNENEIITQEEADANAGFIVKAVNNHESLLEALKELTYSTNNPHSDWSTIREQVENAIKAIKAAEE